MTEATELAIRIGELKRDGSTSLTVGDCNVRRGGIDGHRFITKYDAGRDRIPYFGYFSSAFGAAEYMIQRANRRKALGL